MPMFIDEVVAAAALEAVDITMSIVEVPISMLKDRNQCQVQLAIGLRESVQMFRFDPTDCSRCISTQSRVPKLAHSLSQKVTFSVLPSNLPIKQTGLVPR